MTMTGYDAMCGVCPQEIKSEKPPPVKKQTSVGGHVAEMANRLGMAGGIKMDGPGLKRGTYWSFCLMYYVN